MEKVADILQIEQVGLKQLVIDWIYRHPNEFDALYEISMGDDLRLSWRAAWVISDLVKQNRDFRALIQPHTKAIIRRLKSFKTPGQKREYLKVLQLVEIDQEDWGILIDICFNWLSNRKTDEAIKMHCMQIIFEYGRRFEPDLLSELKLILEENIEFAKAGFKNRGGKLLKKLDGF
ncbi:MAG: hypothetical protein JXR60_03225 [Bacteroidales bacterium]|nr:hypothetical protein [Bacteroidales bacterium]